MFARMDMLSFSILSVLYSWGHPISNQVDRYTPIAVLIAKMRGHDNSNDTYSCGMAWSIINPSLPDLLVHQPR